MTDRTAELEAAVRAQDALIAEAQCLLTDYLSKRTESASLLMACSRCLTDPPARGATACAGSVGRGTGRTCVVTLATGVDRTHIWRISSHPNLRRRLRSRRHRCLCGISGLRSGRPGKR